MKIEFEVNDFGEFLSAFNNSIVALQHIYAGLYFGCEIPLNFDKMLKEKFGNNDEAKIECLRNRVALLYNIYKELEDKENNNADSNYTTSR